MKRTSNNGDVRIGEPPLKVSLLCFKQHPADVCLGHQICNNEDARGLLWDLIVVAESHWTILFMGEESILRTSVLNDHITRFIAWHCEVMVSCPYVKRRTGVRHHCRSNQCPCVRATVRIRPRPRLACSAGQTETASQDNWLRNHLQASVMQQQSVCTDLQSPHRLRHRALWHSLDSKSPRQLHICI